MRSVKYSHVQCWYKYFICAIIILMNKQRAERPYFMNN